MHNKKVLFMAFFWLHDQIQIYLFFFESPKILAFAWGMPK